MRVLLSAYACDPYKGSECSVGWGWARSLAEGGCGVSVLTSPEWRADIEHELARNPVPNLRFVFVEVPRWVQHVAHGQPGVYLTYLAWQRRAYHVARRITRSQRFDVVHHVSWGSLQLGSELGRLGLPFVFGPVGGGQTMPDALSPFYPGNRLSEAVRTFVTRRLLAVDLPARSALHSAALTLVSNDDTAALARRSGARTVEYFSETGTDPERMVAQPPTQPSPPPLRLLWLARLLPRKGLPLALRVIAAVPEHVQVHLSIVGDGPLAAQLPRWMDELGVGRRVSYLGGLAWDEVARCYRDHHALLFTSLRDSTGAQLLEAMSFGLPILALDQHGARNFVPSEAGIKVPVHSPQQVVDDLASAIVSLAEDPDLGQRMKQAAWRFARSQSWRQRAEVMMGMYSRAQAVAGV
jgi:glycosyltransferase involved in cell wall biosynthesis